MDQAVRHVLHIKGGYKMQRKLIEAVLIVVVLGAGILACNGLDSSHRQTNVPSVDTTRIDLSAEMTPTLTRPQDTITAAQATPVTDTQTQQTGLALMTTLMENADKQHFKPGWVHFSNEFDRHADKGAGTLPNNVNIPDQYLEEGYAHLDENGLAFEEVSYMKSMEGKPIQTSVFSKGKWHTQEFDNEYEDDPSPYTPSLAILNDFKWRSENGAQITSEKMELDGKPVYLFISTYEIKDPQKFDDYKLPVIKMENKAYISEDGQLKQYDAFYTFTDGSTLLYAHSSNYIVEWNIEPPSEIINLVK
jgi:hypothetical protein